MLPDNIITAWAADHPWPARTQVEQDLLLSQAICEISNHSYLGDELAFRGGTALHKLHTAQPYRYSEDLDYVRSTAGGIADLTRALTDVGQILGYRVNTRVGEHPKVYWRTNATDGSLIRIKIEVNTYERSPALDHIRIPYQVNSAWWSGEANVKTFQPPELVATKIRALYQRSKGRDVFDLWIALTELNTDPDTIVTAFSPYRPDGWTPALAAKNLQNKLGTDSFTSDLGPLVQYVPDGFSITSACELILTELIQRVDR
jgi:predicted nucleotidyltransferase component of viral defense system